MTAFRAMLIAAWLTLTIYTGTVIADHGIGLFPIFFGDITAAIWPGQFNADFLCFLMLSALWTAWRNNFTATALFLAAVAFVGGAGFLLPYLLFLSFKTRGDIDLLLTGRVRA